MAPDLSTVSQEHRPGNKLRQDKWRAGLYDDNCERKESKSAYRGKTREYRNLSKHIQIPAQNTGN
eukprot:1208175-Heterocapsa_arctica.AAC.1